jgi:hypothetical protein
VGQQQRGADHRDVLREHRLLHVVLHGVTDVPEGME